jgi:hypothetical protein
MVLIQKKSRKKPIIYGILAFIVIFGGGYLIFKNYIIIPPPTNQTKISEKNLPTYTDFGEDLFQENSYESLQDFSGDKLPILPDRVPKGRENPFIPKL